MTLCTIWTVYVSFCLQLPAEAVPQELKGLFCPQTFPETIRQDRTASTLYLYQGSLVSLSSTSIKFDAFLHSTGSCVSEHPLRIFYTITFSTGINLLVHSSENYIRKDGTIIVILKIEGKLKDNSEEQIL